MGYPRYMTTTYPHVKWEPTTINGTTYPWRAETLNGSTYAFAYFLTVSEAVAWCDADTIGMSIADVLRIGAAADNADDGARKRGDR